MRALAITAAFVAGLTPLLTQISHAQAPPPRHALRWTRGPGAESCIDAAVLRASVESRLRRRVFVASDVAPVVIDAHIAPAASGWHVAIAVRDEAGASIGARELCCGGDNLWTATCVTTGTCAPLEQCCHTEADCGGATPFCCPAAAIDVRTCSATQAAGCT